MNFLDLQTIWAPRVLSVLRIVAALLFLEHGTQKLLGFPPSPNPAPTLLSIFGIAGLLELIGGALLAAGLFTRPVALILSGEMAVAYWMVHAPRSFFPLLNGGEPAILYCFVSFISPLRVAVRGASTRPGKLALRGLDEGRPLSASADCNEPADQGEGRGQPPLARSRSVVRPPSGLARQAVRNWPGSAML